MVAVILFAVMFILMLLGVPIVFAICAAGAAAILGGGIQVPLTVVVQRTFAGMDSFALCCIPFFILTGQFMSCGDLSKRLLRLAEVFVGRIPGGLAHVNVVFSMLFGGMSGSSSADVAAEGPILMPLMHQAGYDDGFTVAVTAATATIGVIILPSNMMIIYAMVAGSISITDMFLGGILPGILIGLSFLVVCYLTAKIHHYPKGMEMNRREKLRAIREGILPLITFFIIILGTLLGIFTPTEAAIVAALYNFILSKFVYRSMKLSDLPRMLINTGFMTAGVMMLIGVSSIFSWLLAYTKLPELLIDVIFSFTQAKYPILLMMMLVFLLIGMVMDDAPACIIFVPMFLPIAMQLGVNPIQFGIWCVMCLAIGQYTPPVGAVLFLSCKIGKCSIERATKALIPFLTADILCCLLVLFFEPLTTWIPQISKLFA